MARPVYQYRPIKTDNTIPLGIALPFNKPSGKRSVDSVYTAAPEDAGTVFVSTYSTEEQAVSNVKNLLMTAKGERFFQPEFGTELRSLLFEQNIKDLQPSIETSLKKDFEFWLPYISIEKIEMEQPEHDLIIRLKFRIISTGANLVINILADENTFTVGDIEPDTETPATEFVQINTGDSY